MEQLDNLVGDDLHLLLRGRIDDRQVQQIHRVAIPRRVALDGYLLPD